MIDLDRKQYLSTTIINKMCVFEVRRDRKSRESSKIRFEEKSMYDRINKLDHESPNQGVFLLPMQKCVCFGRHRKSFNS